MKTQKGIQTRHVIKLEMYNQWLRKRRSDLSDRQTVTGFYKVPLNKVTGFLNWNLSVATERIVENEQLRKGLLMA